MKKTFNISVKVKFWVIVFIIYLILGMLLGCSSSRMICPVYKDTYNNRQSYKRHWMNRKFDTNILYYDTENYFTTKCNIKRDENKRICK